MSLKAPKRKKRVKQPLHGPFPVPIQTITGDVACRSNWLYYTGYLNGNVVKVKHAGDMDFLYKMGFFGKGSLSRSRPEYNENFRWAAISQSDNHTIYPRIVNKHWYKRHLQWSGEEVSEDETTSESEYHHEDTNTENGHSRINLVSQESCEISPKEDVTEIENKTSWVQDKDGSVWSDSVKEKNNEVTSKTLTSVEWDEGDGDSDFWNSNDTSCVKTDLIATDSHDCGTNISGNLPPETKCERTEDKSEELASCSPEKKAKLSIGGSSSSTFQPLPTQEHSEAPVRTGDDENSSLDNCVTPVNGTNIESDLTYYDPLCQHNDTDSDLFVIPTEHFGETSKHQHRNKLKWKPVLKRNPYPIKEYLQLSFMEAFFLSYGLGCFVLKENEKVLDLTSMWEIFCSRQRNFIPSYITYHYYRSKGWVPKSGLKFGCDYILYKVGPPFYHGSYSVITQFVNEGTLTVIPDFQQRSLSWRSLSGLNRITEHVGKEVMICYVIKPTSMTQEEMMKPSCIPKFKVKEVLLSRWVSSQERQNKEPEEIP